MSKSDKQTGNDFSRQADTATPSLVREFVAFLRHNKKWWLAPLILVMLMFGVILLMSSSVAAPFIYTLF